MNLLKSLTMVSIITLLSRLLGFIRDSLIAKIFGAGVYSDSFFMAFKLPNLLRRIFAEGAFSQAFTPVLAEYKNRRSIIETKEFISAVLGILTILLSIVVVLGIIFSTFIISIIAPGFVTTTYKLLLTSKMLKITFPYILLISLSSIASAILNIWKNFLVPAFTPILLNLCMIFFIIFCPFCFNPPVLILAWSVIIGGFIQLMYQLIYLKRINMLVQPRCKFVIYNNIHGVIKVFQKMGIAIIGVSATQISLLINSVFASFLITGSVTWIYYADRLMELPIGMFAIALSIVLLPALTDAFTTNNEKEYNQLIDLGLRLCFLLIVPSSLMLGFFSKILLISLFQYGAFTYFDVLMTQKNLIIYAIGLLFIITSKVLALGYYARQNVKTPVSIAIFVLVITQLISPIFIYFLHHIGFAISICLAAFLNFILLLSKLVRNKIYIPESGWYNFLIRITIVTTILGILLLFFSMIISEQWLILSSLQFRIIFLCIFCFFILILYMLVLFLLGFRLQEFSLHKTKI
ncbi:murein biosynthesis integral membrane protein MurJ [Enterobacteriaceae endosymbiont of Plateumaris braccata]|uniref:murein biosynthesis integral membrane protein MurJ n=1 Tax=Enterobacteriaceae endosymbiont of Plateumaris braccata TaxID=2675793 RepID=UPI0014498DEB|nr:murein biosynthesis integral membrane protein MurJ [Enterobacteriaceae endosymbiont of Plateumaris braccata]QJC28311.1 murein biosynthesis integral membrane protein MurJ [Enterobacteriaceae endosymbiont of Plateumaris braccata]